MRHAIPEASFLQISHAANWVPTPQRAAFIQAVADNLTGVEVGEGSVARAIARAFRAVFDPPLDTGDPPRPHVLRKTETARE